MSRTSTGRARAEPPEEVTSRATVLMVEAGELGSGGKEEAGMEAASEVVFAETTTARKETGLLICSCSSFLLFISLSASQLSLTIVALLR